MTDAGLCVVAGAMVALTTTTTVEALFAWYKRRTRERRMAAGERPVTGGIEVGGDVVRFVGVRKWWATEDDYAMYCAGAAIAALAKGGGR